MGTRENLNKWRVLWVHRIFPEWTKITFLPPGEMGSRAQDINEVQIQSNKKKSYVIYMFKFISWCLYFTHPYKTCCCPYRGGIKATINTLQCSLCEAHWEKILEYQYWEYFLPLGNWFIFNLGNCDLRIWLNVSLSFACMKVWSQLWTLPSFC